MQRHERLKAGLGVGDIHWELKLEQELKRSQLETSAEYASRVQRITSTKQTAFVYGKMGGLEPEHFAYDADRQVLRVNVRLGGFPEAAIGTVATVDGRPTGACLGSFGRGMSAGRRDSVSSNFAFTNARIPCTGQFYSLVSQDVPVPLGEMRSVLQRLVWELDVTPSPTAAGHIKGAQVLKGVGAGDLYVSAVLVKLHELRLVDPDTRKVYFRALMP